MQLARSGASRWAYEDLMVFDILFDAALVLLCAELIRPEGNRATVIKFYCKDKEINRIILIFVGIATLFTERKMTQPGLTFSGAGRSRFFPPHVGQTCANLQTKRQDKVDVLSRCISVRS